LLLCDGADQRTVGPTDLVPVTVLPCPPLPMAHRLDVSLTAPFSIDDVVAVVTLETGTETSVVLRGGQISQDFPARAVKIRLTTEPPPPGEAPLALALPEKTGVPRGTPVDVLDLFDVGTAIPPNGRLVQQVSWGAHCHSDRLPDAPEGKRFASWEHVICAEFVGLDRVADDGTARPLTFNGITAQFTKSTPLPLGRNTLTFGDVVCLGGDFYAHLDDTAAGAFSWAWPALTGLTGWIAGDYRRTTLAGDEPRLVAQLLEVIARDRDVRQGAAGEFTALALDTALHHYPARRYLALSSQNYCHFVCTTADRDDDSNEALRLYRVYHTRALAEARAARAASDSGSALLGALASDAFGCHFLTDLFATGHLRVPRRILGERYGILRGALYMTLTMHNEDNVEGLWCTTRRPTEPREVWRAYGDGMLRGEPARAHLRRVQEAVRRSAAEVFAAYCDAETKVDQRAEAVLPVPLSPGERPSIRDVLVDGSAGWSDVANHWPLYDIDSRGRIRRRIGERWENRYRHVEHVLNGREEER
jgi:hypothetical protein